MFSTGMGPLASSFFALATMLIAIPTGVKIFNWIGTIWGGLAADEDPALLRACFIAMFIIGGLSGVMHPLRRLICSRRTPTSCRSHFHYVCSGVDLCAHRGRLTGGPRCLAACVGEAWEVAFLDDDAGVQLTFFPSTLPTARHAPKDLHLFRWARVQRMELMATAGAAVCSSQC